MSTSASARIVSALMVGPGDELDSLFPDNLHCEVDHVRTAAHAIARLAAKRYDIVLVDHTSGGDLTDEQLAYLRAARAAACPQSKFIVVASNTTPLKVVEALRQGVFAYFSRPFDSEAVRYAIIQALKSSSWPLGIEVLSADPEFITIRLRCCLETADRLTHFMRELPCGLSDSENFAVSAAFSEMLINAIEHGGKLDPNEWVRVSMVRTKRVIIYHLHDPGQGFSREVPEHGTKSDSLEDPMTQLALHEQDNMSPCGFGMLIATQLVDEVKYNARGNEVILIKYIESAS